MDSGLEIPDPKDKALCGVLDEALSNRMFTVERVAQHLYGIYSGTDKATVVRCLFKWKDEKRKQMHAVLGIDARMALKIIRANWDNRVEDHWD